MCSASASSSSKAAASTQRSKNKNKDHDVIVEDPKPRVIPPTPPTGCEAVGNAIDRAIHTAFYRVGKFVAFRPKLTIALSILLAVICGAGFVKFTTENRPDELWVPQNTVAEQEAVAYLTYYPSTSRINTMILSHDNNVLTKEALLEALQLQETIQTTPSSYNGTNYTLVDLCTPAGGSCVSSFTGVCGCLMTGILKQWNYNATLLQLDNDYMATLQAYGTRQDLEAVLGNPVFDTNNNNTLVSAQAFTTTYFLQDRSFVQDGTEQDPMNEQWELTAFLNVIQSFTSSTQKQVTVDYFSSRSFSDEFGDAISGDLLLVQVSYVVTFIFLGATLGRVKCGPNSRWTMSIAALVMIALSTVAGFGISSTLGLFFGPVHSLLPFILLGIGVDDCFVIVNAFDRERGNTPRNQEDDDALVDRCARGLARAGASVTVTSLTDLVAFAISSSSALPALASFCAFASISVTFLWFFASTFFTACLVLDEYRQRDNRRDCLLCCLTRKSTTNADDNNNQEETTTTTTPPVTVNDNEEGIASKYFRNYHAPAILSKPGKAIVLLFFSGLLAFGIYGAMNLTVENTEREFIPKDSYLVDYIAAADTWFADDGISFFIVFEEPQANNIGSSIYDKRNELAALDDRLAQKSTVPPYIAEPVSEDAYRNVMAGLQSYLLQQGTNGIGGATVGSDGWPDTQEGFIMTLEQFVDFGAPGFQYARDVALVTDAATNTTRLEAIRIESEYVKLTKVRRSEIIEDATKQIEAMDATREMVDSWTDLPPAFVYSDIYLGVEGFKIIRQELFLNVGLAIASVAVIVLLTVASFMTTLLITLNVGFCIVEILGFMWAIGIVIDSVSVINIVLAVGLSVDYCAHVGHSFMVKGGNNRDRRVTECLADIGAAVLCGATSTFLAVAVLLGSSSYVFDVLSTQFALTVGLGVLHGLVLLPVMLSLVGPKPFSSAERIDGAVEEQNVADTRQDDSDEQGDKEEDDKGRIMNEIDV